MRIFYCFVARGPFFSGLYCFLISSVVGWLVLC